MNRSKTSLYNDNLETVHVIGEMRKGCAMVILKFNESKFENIDSKDFCLSKNNASIQCCLTQKKFIDIDNFGIVEDCNENDIESILSFMNVSGLQDVGLKHILFKIRFKNKNKNHNETWILAFDNFKNKQIWFYGLQSILCSKKLASSLKPDSLSLVITDEYSTDSDNGISYCSSNRMNRRRKRKSRFDFSNATFVETIKGNLDGISESINLFNSFCSSHCIFGSEFHISLLSESTRCMQLLKETKDLLKINDQNRQIFFSRNNHDIYYLKKSWIKLNEQLAIACLKSLQVRTAISRNNLKAGEGNKHCYETPSNSCSPVVSDVESH